ncbi:YciI family protein [Aliiroseovarius sp. KMU-50]|uniref:YciI family protein n=1 Tax=Aliiroseovarius salicola TaxID=3009082 RepID=A0ABT4W4Q5_9RHOB|nr:YciI family protein [Aliiroseovarius sp. KMU-50]MDA5095436.1 YciI family protein [Aliiroseovarius sp. KMU-50]
MPQFYMAYHVTGAMGDADAQADNQARYKAWMEKHAGALVVPAQPLGPQWTITAEGAEEGFEGSMMGYSVLEAADLDAAIAIAKECPFCEMGNLQLAEMMTMPGKS